MIGKAINSVIEGASLDSEGMAEVMGSIVDGAASPAQVGALLTALRLRGETEEEIAGAAVALRRRALPFPAGDAAGELLDTCGTGGDGAGTVNVSTLAALVAAAAGARVAKHGNRAVSSSCGSADLLAALGVDTGVSPAVAGRCLEETGFAFLFAPLYHPAMKAVAPVRRELGFRTIFNMIGPLCNPAGARRQLLGVFSRDMVPVMAGVLRRLGAVRAMVVSSEDGLDELSVSAPTLVAELDEGEIRIRTLEPARLGLGNHPPESLRGGGAEENARLAMEMLEGGKGPVRDAVLLNAAAAIAVAGIAPGVEEALPLAAKAVDGGGALAVLHRVRSITGEAAA